VTASLEWLVHQYWEDVHAVRPVGEFVGEHLCGDPK